MKLAQDLQVGEKVHKKGEECPASEELRLLLHNREYLDINVEAGLPVLTGEDLKKYGSYFIVKEAAKPKMKIKPKPYSQSNLNERLNKLGFEKFKEWAETKFGEDNIDRRKKSKAIINEILAIQERDRQ